MLIINFITYITIITLFFHKGSKKSMTNNHNFLKPLKDPFLCFYLEHNLCRSKLYRSCFGMHLYLSAATTLPIIFMLYKQFIFIVIICE